MKLKNLENGQILADKLGEASSFYQRFKGLMFTKELEPGYGLLIKPCRSIHTFFMKYKLDIVHLDSHNQVVLIEEGLPPGKIGKGHLRTRSIVELPAGMIETTQTKVGDFLQVVPS